jgi:CRP-like cAMP-binding protein
MSDAVVLEKAIEAIVVLNAAFTNIRLYPPTSAMISKSIGNAESILNDIFGQEDSITFAESEKNLVISGQGLDGKDGKRPQVIAFIQMMLKLNIKSITFEKGLEKSEILNFLEVVTKKSEDLRKEGGIQKVMSDKHMRHIHVDQKVYVSMDKGQRFADEKTPQDTSPTIKKDRLPQIKAGIEAMVRGETEPFKDKIVMQAMAPAILDLISRGKEKTAEAILRKLGEGALSERVEVRNEASMAMARIGARFLSEKRMDDMIRLSHKLVDWIKFETLLQPAHKPAANQLKLMTQHLIANRRNSEAIKLLMPFYMIESAKLKKDDQIKVLAADVLKGAASDEIMESLIREAGSIDSKTPESPTIDQVDESATLSPPDTELAQNLKSVEQLVKARDIKAAGKMLFDLIMSYAKNRDFEAAETLRDKLMDIDPMALGDIIKSGEIIEDEKNKAIDQGHLNLWSDLYKTLSKEESSTLYFALKSIKFNAGDLIYKKSGNDSRLYFINKGNVKLFIDQEGGKETVIRELKPGDLMGQEAFFTLSLCSSSAAALTNVELNYLEKAILTKWESKSCGIESKLHDYDLKIKKAEEKQGAKGPQLRVHERIAISGKVRVQFLDATGNIVGESITGMLSDISQGGLSFYLNIKKEKISNLFLNPRLNLKFSIKTQEAELTIDINGTMVAAVPHFYDYSIHVKFDKRLDKRMMEGIKASSGSEDAELDFLREP